MRENVRGNRRPWDLCLELCLLTLQLLELGFEGGKPLRIAGWGLSGLLLGGLLFRRLDRLAFPHLERFDGILQRPTVIRY